MPPRFRGKPKMTALIAVLASTAPATVPTTTTPGLNERARQANSAAPMRLAAATVALLAKRAVINVASSRRWDRWTAFPIQDAVGASSAVTHPWTCTPIASQVKANTSPARPKAVGIRRLRNGAPIFNDNSDVHERDFLRSTATFCTGTVRHAPPAPVSVIVAELRYSPVNFGARLAKVAEIPSDRSLDGRNTAFHAAT